MRKRRIGNSIKNVRSANGAESEYTPRERVVIKTICLKQLLQPNPNLNTHERQLVKLMEFLWRVCLVKDLKTLNELAKTDDL